MREIKFRGYHPDADDMVYFGLGEDSLPCCSLENDDLYTFRLSDGHPVMQFTGLQDKNGDDIYEGDIIDMCGMKGEIQFEECTAKFIWVETDDREFGHSFDRDEGEYIEVIGNIHQNGDLLEES